MRAVVVSLVLLGSASALPCTGPTDLHFVFPDRDQMVLPTNARVFFFYRGSVRVTDSSGASTVAEGRDVESQFILREADLSGHLVPGESYVLTNTAYSQNEGPRVEVVVSDGPDSDPIVLESEPTFTYLGPLDSVCFGARHSVEAVLPMDPAEVSI